MQVRLVRLFGIDVYLHWTFVLLPLLLFGLMRIGDGLAWEAIGGVCLVSGIGLVSVICHEFGHALMARSLGIGIRDILITPIGGMARMERLSPRPLPELLVTLAGPVVNLMIALICAGLVGFTRQGWVPNWDEPLFGQALAIGMWSNLLLLVFNLLPAFPMDGGRILRSLLAMVLPFETATRISIFLGQFLAWLMVLAGCFWQIYALAIVGGFVFWSARSESRSPGRRNQTHQASST